MSGRYQAYPEYKDSGVEWLGKIPNNWMFADLRRGIKLLTDFEANGSFAEVKNNVNLDTEEKYAWYLRATDLENNRLGIVEGNRTCDRNAYNYLSKTKLFGGEFLVAKRGEIGKIYVVPELPSKTTLAPNLYLIRLNEHLNSKFVYYWYSSSYGNPELILADKSTTIGALYKDDVKSCKILFPNINDQEKIVNFLDHETAKIDTLIEKQQQLIKLLKEKRQAVISHAVTKGLNPNVKMKDSGIEWLGEVPEHWKVKPLKCVCNLIDGDRSSVYPNESELVDDGIPFVSSKNIVNYKLTKNNLNYITEQKFAKLSRGKLVAGDLVITVRGTIGHVGIFDPVIIGCETGFINAQMMIIRPSKGLTDYIQLVSESSLWQSQLEVLAYGSTVKQLSNEVLGNISIAIPSFDELSNFVNDVKKCCEKIEHLIFRAQSAVELLQERRTALISAAVTGKIDVRNFKATGD